MDATHTSMQRSTVGWSSSVLAHGLMVGLGILLAREFPPPLPAHTPSRIELRLLSHDEPQDPSSVEAPPLGPASHSSARVPRAEDMPRRSVSRGTPVSSPPVTTVREDLQPATRAQPVQTLPVKRAILTHAPVSPVVRSIAQRQPIAAAPDQSVMQRPSRETVVEAARTELREVVHAQSAATIRAVEEHIERPATVETHRIVERPTASSQPVSATWPARQTHTTPLSRADESELPAVVQGRQATLQSAPPVVGPSVQQTPAIQTAQISRPIRLQTAPVDRPTEDTAIHATVRTIRSATLSHESEPMRPDEASDALIPPLPDMSDVGFPDSPSTFANGSMPAAVESPAVDTTPPASSSVAEHSSDKSGTTETAVASLMESPTLLPTPIGGSIPLKADYGWLTDSLRRRLESFKTYPRLARMHGWEGKVVVRAVIKADGNLAHQAIEESSGHEALDQDALDLMKQVCPLALKHPLGQPQVTVYVPIHYRIEP